MKEPHDVSSLGVFADDWFKAAFGALPPAEPSSTCSSCAMCDERSPIKFLATTKCCTYWPLLPNYAVGGVLAAAMAPGGIRDQILQMVASDYATPRGLGRSAYFETLFDQRGQAEFGRSERLVCPYLHPSGQCGIWEFRTGACSTFFCKMTRGTVSLELWSAIAGWLQAIEQTLSLWAAIQLGVAPAAALSSSLWKSGEKVDRRRLDADGGGSRDPRWGRWQDTRLEFYGGCYSLVRALTWPNVAQYGGVQLDACTQRVQRAVAALADQRMPLRVSLGKVQTVAVSNECVLLETYRPLDPQWLSLSLLEVLSCFRGQLTEEALAEASRRGVHLDHATLRRMVDFGILTDTEPLGSDAVRDDVSRNQTETVAGRS